MQRLATCCNALRCVCDAQCCACARSGPLRCAATHWPTASGGLRRASSTRIGGRSCRCSCAGASVRRKRSPPARARGRTHACARRMPTAAGPFEGGVRRLHVRGAPLVPWRHERTRTGARHHKHAHAHTDTGLHRHTRMHNMRAPARARALARTPPRARTYPRTCTRIRAHTIAVSARPRAFADKGVVLRWLSCVYLPGLFVCLLAAR